MAAPASARALGVDRGWHAWLTRAGIMDHMGRLRMRRVLAPLLVSAPLLLLGAGWPAAPVPLLDALRLGRPASRIEAPAFDSVTLEGRPVRLGELRGRVVLLYFWTTW